MFPASKLVQAQWLVREHNLIAAHPAGWLSGKYRLGAEEPPSQRAGLIPGRFDVTQARNRAKLEAADALAELAESNGLSLVDLAVAFALNHPAVSSVVPARCGYVVASLAGRQEHTEPDSADVWWGAREVVSAWA